MCLTKIIQNSPDDLIRKMTPKLAPKLTDFMSNMMVKSKTQLMECFLSMLEKAEQDS
jgi:hypothetical protein